MDDMTAWSSPEDPAVAARRGPEAETQAAPRRPPLTGDSARYVPDPCASDAAWMVTVPTIVDVGAHDRNHLPEVVGVDNAALTAWVRDDDYPTLTGHLATANGATVFPPKLAC